MNKGTTFGYRALSWHFLTMLVRLRDSFAEKKWDIAVADKGIAKVVDHELADGLWERIEA